MKRINRERCCISLVICLLFFVIFFEKQIIKKERNEKMINRDSSDKHFALFMLMNQWLRNTIKEKKIADYLSNRGYKKIAVYGMSYVGNLLIDELNNSEIEVVYGIDQNPNIMYTDLEVVSKDSINSDVDAIIVTAIKSFNEIKEDLSLRVSVPILSLEDIIFDL